MRLAVINEYNKYYTQQDKQVIKIDGLTSKERRMRMDAKELRYFLEKATMTINNEIDNIADDELRDKLEQLVLNIKDTRNYIRFNFEEED